MSFPTSVLLGSCVKRRVLRCDMPRDPDDRSDGPWRNGVEGKGETEVRTERV